MSALAVQPDRLSVRDLIGETVRLQADLPVQLEAKEEGKAGPRRFTMTAYTGALVRLRWFGPIVFDLDGIDLGDGARPVFRQHDPNKLVGQTSKLEKKSRTLKAEGFFLEGDSFPYAREVVSAADQGMRWQCSIGLDFLNEDDVEELGKNAKAEVNGMTVVGPALVVRKSVLQEISFVPLGADGDTSAAVLARYGREANAMPKGTQEPEKGAADQDKAPAANADLEQIRSEFADDPAFALDAICRGLTLEQARAERQAKDAKRVPELEEQITKLHGQVSQLQRENADLRAAAKEGKKPHAGARPVEGVAGEPEKPASTATTQCQELIKKLGDDGVPKAQAWRTIAKDHPELHAAYLEECRLAGRSR